MRSPGTIANLERTPALEIVFLDVLARRAVRVAGEGRIVSTADAHAALLAPFERKWAEYLPHMHALVRVEITRAQSIDSPAYDLGHDEAELRAANLAKLSML